MGGESIKPIRKRIHVYFLMTAYIKGSNNLKIKLAEVNKGSNTNTANQIAKSLNFSEIDSTETRLIEGSDTPVVPRKKSLWLRLLQLVHLQ